MSLALEPRVQELSSQAALLERMQLLTNFSSNLIHVTGETGSGKTWIAQRYLEAWAQDKNQSLLMCFHNQSDPLRRHTILSQLRPNSRFDPDAELVDSFYQLFGDDSCNVVIAIDDAQLLSEAMLSELWLLVLEAQNQPKWSINVILFALPDILDRVLTRLSYGQEQKPVDLEIEVLPAEDADRLFEFFVMRFVEDKMERAVRSAYGKVKKLPGEIMALGEQKMEKRVIIRSIVGAPMNIAVVIMLLALVIGGGYWWFLGQTSVPDVAQQNEPADQSQQDALSGMNGEQTVIPTLSSETSPPDDSRDNLSLSANEQTSAVVFPGPVDSAPVSSSATNIDPNAMDDSDALPPTVISNGESVGIDDQDRQRVVITSDVVDALLDNHPVPSSAVSKAAIEMGVVSTAPDKVDGTVSVPVEPEPLDHSASQSSPSALPSAGAKHLLAMPEHSYTLQLAAFNEQSDVDKFIRRNDLADKANVYKTLRQDVIWFIVTYDNFATLQFARDAVDELPLAVQEQSPWAKSLRQVHREIEAVK